jgi:hypothetical protein
LRPKRRKPASGSRLSRPPASRWLRTTAST